MTQSVKKMPTPGGIGAGQTATVSLPLGLTYETIFIRMNVGVGDPAVATDVPVDDWGTYLDEIRLVVNGNVTYQIDAKDQVELNKIYKQPMVDGTLPIFLARPWMRTMGGEDQTAYKTAGGVDTFTMEIDVKAGIDLNSLEIYAHQSAGVEPWGAHLRMQRFHHQQGLVGVAEISDIPRANYHMLALHLTSDKIKQAEVIVNNNKIIDYDKSTRDTINILNGRENRAGYTTLDFQSKNRAVEAMPMKVQDFRLKLDFTETGTYAIYAESIVGAGGL